MTFITPTTKLEAVNRVLASIGETPVSSLSNTTGADVVTAVQTLDNVSREVQLEGWQFNTEYDFPLTRDTEGQITIPVNALKVDVARYYFGDTDPVLRGSRVYDRKNHTYVFTDDLKAKVVFGFLFEELPESARAYITIRTARLYQQESFGAETLNAYKERDEMIARARFCDDQADDEDLNFLRDTPGLNQIWSV